MKASRSRPQSAVDLLPHRWSGEVTWRDAAELREALFDRLEAPASLGVHLDVRDVTYIDISGVALLIGANFRASSAGRALALLDNEGAVSRALAKRHVLSDFQVTSGTGARGHADLPRRRQPRLRATPLAVLGGAA